MSKTRWILAATLLAALFLVACGGGGSEPEVTGPQPATIEVVQNDIYYGDTPDNAANPPQWTVPAGAPVTIDMVNNGGLEHNWAVVGLNETVPEVFNEAEDSDIIIIQTGLVQPGQSFSDVFNAPTEPGTYTVICTVAGHYPSMQGRLVVN